MKKKICIVTLIIVTILITTGYRFFHHDEDENVIKIKYFPENDSYLNSLMISRLIDPLIDKYEKKYGVRIQLELGISNNGSKIIEDINKNFIRRGDADIVITYSHPLGHIFDNGLAMDLSEKLDNFDKIQAGLKNNYAVGISQRRFLFKVYKDFELDYIDRDSYVEILKNSDIKVPLSSTLIDSEYILDYFIDFNELCSDTYNIDNIENDFANYKEFMNRNVYLPKSTRKGKYLLNGIDNFNANKEYYESMPGLCIAVPSITGGVVPSDIEAGRKSSDIGMSDNEYKNVATADKKVIYVMVPKISTNKEIALEIVDDLISYDYQKAVMFPRSDYGMMETNIEVLSYRLENSILTKELVDGIIKTGESKDKYSLLDMNYIEYEIFEELYLYSTFEFFGWTKIEEDYFSKLCAKINLFRNE